LDNSRWFWVGFRLNFKGVLVLGAEKITDLKLTKFSKSILDFIKIFQLISQINIAKSRATK
jgi:hypothetical protein